MFMDLEHQQDQVQEQMNGTSATHRILSHQEIVTLMVLETLNMLRHQDTMR